MSLSARLKQLVEDLKDPLLVVKFQRCFGVGHDPLDSLQKIGSDGVHESDEYCEFGDGQEGGAEFIRENTGSTKALLKRRDHKKTKAQDEIGKSKLTVPEDRKDDDVVDNASRNAEEDEDVFDKVVQNKFWYYFFLFGTAMGDEIFYASFFSFWFWNVDGAVGRRVVLVWALVMYIGQGLKDIICWPRPASPPVIRLEKKWELEYGMPSTHAMTGAAVPFSILIFTAYRYEYPIAVGVILALTWCTLVCSSRLYLGMHSVLDIIAGLLLVSVLFLWVIPFVDWLDPILLTHELGSAYLLSAAVLLAVCSPGGDRWTPARGDTIIIVGSVVGMISGAWMNYQLGIINSNGPPIDPPFPVIWPSYKMLGLSLLRLIIGLAIVGLTREIVKPMSKAFFKGLVDSSKNISCNVKPSTREVFVELSYKFVTYMSMGFNIVFLAPAVFRLVGIERPTFHTEV